MKKYLLRYLIFLNIQYIIISAKKFEKGYLKCVKLTNNNSDLGAPEIN